MNTTDSENLGGVASYYRNLRPFFNSNIEYFTVGARHKISGKNWNIFRIFNDYYEFIKRLRNQDYDIVHLNPSLVPCLLAPAASLYWGWVCACLAPL